MAPPKAAQSFIAGNVGIGTFYFVASIVSWDLLTPPGYATAIWPAAGIALAMILLYGTRLWPGLLTGATLANLSHLHDSMVVDIGLYSAIPIAIGLGIAATLQALAGHWLLRNRMDLAAGLVDPPSVLRLIILGGPVTCLISATSSVAILHLFGIIEPHNLLFDWVTWWVGDSIGVMLVAPLMFVWLGQSRETWQGRKTGVGVPVVVTFAVVLMIYLIEIDNQKELVQTRFENQAESLGDSLEEKLHRDFEALFSLQSLFDTAESIDREKFYEFVRGPLERNSDIHALSWNPVIANAHRADFEASMRALGITDFEITERNAAGEQVRAGEREFYVVVQYIEPLEQNLKALGYDVFSNTRRKEALRSAHITGELTGTAPITLVQEIGSQAGVLFIMPVQRYPSASRQQAAAADLPSGYAVGVFRIRSLLQKIADNSDVHSVMLRLTDVDDSARPVLLAEYLRGGDSTTPHDFELGSNSKNMYWQRFYSLGNRNWSFEVLATPEYISGTPLWVPWGMFVTGLIFTVALSAFLLILSGRRIVDQTRADQLADEIKQREAVESKLQLANERLEIIARTDELTQIYNRRALEEIGHRLEAEALRYNAQFAVLMLDIDHFKSVNDRFGHQIGDLVLKDFTNKIRETLRDVDDFGRWGGEEFQILARNSGLAESAEFAERLVAMIASWQIEPIGKITTSIGVAVRRDQETFDDVVLRADRALYTAKRNGRNRAEVDKTTELPTRRKGA